MDTSRHGQRVEPFTLATGIGHCYVPVWDASYNDREAYVVSALWDSRDPDRPDVQLRHLRTKKQTGAMPWDQFADYVRTHTLLPHDRTPTLLPAGSWPLGSWLVEEASSNILRLHGIRLSRRFNVILEFRDADNRKQALQAAQVTADVDAGRRSLVFWGS